LSIPISPDARIDLIDIIRGFALFGVMLANMVWTVYFFALTPEQREALPNSSLDLIANRLTLLLVDFKFYTLFSMLFGIGFAMQITRAKVHDQRALGVYIRRLCILFFMGVAHALLLWFGDILHLYALLGFVLILFRNTDDRALIRWVITFAVIMVFMPVLAWVFGGNPIDGMKEEMVENIESYRFTAMREGNWTDIIRLNWNFNKSEYSNLSFGFDSSIYWYLSVLWKFLLGFLIGRKLLLQESWKHLDFFRRIFPWALGIGLLGNGFMLVFTIIYQEWIGDTSGVTTLLLIPVEIGMFALSMAYLCGLVLLYQRPKWQSWLRLLAPVGRMALTNYLSQSFLFVALFYGVGLGLIGKIGAAACLLISIIFFGIQIIVSRWWVRNFRFGPFEWIWRSLTYGMIQPFRIVRTTAGKQ
jgi:uncharacterized protein